MRILFWSIIVALAAVFAAAAECGNCNGLRVVGPGAVRLPCPVCEGTGTVATVVVRGRPRPAVARITAADGPSRISGSGVLVSASGTTGIVVTNWHVVRSHRDGITVAFPDGASSAGRVTASDEAWDLAALVVAKPAASPVVVAAAPPRIGERLTIAGYGPAGVYREESGPVTDFLSPTGRHPRQFIEVRAAARQGDSGGPIFNEAGELAGVLFGCKDGLTCGSSSTRVAAFLSGVPGDCAGGRCRK